MISSPVFVTQLANNVIIPNILCFQEINNYRREVYYYGYVVFPPILMITQQPTKVLYVNDIRLISLLHVRTTSAMSDQVAIKHERLFSSLYTHNTYTHVHTDTHKHRHTHTHTQNTHTHDIHTHTETHTHSLHTMHKNNTLQTYVNTLLCV